MLAIINRMKRVPGRKTDDTLEGLARIQRPARQKPINGSSTGVNDPNGMKNQRYRGKIGEKRDNIN
jgi:hypothetical protein